MRSLLFSFLFVSCLLCGALGVKKRSLPRKTGGVGRIPPGVFGSCGGIKSGRQGYFASPNFPGQYAPLQSCEWKIIVTRGKIIKFEFVYMDMENGPKQLGGTCAADWLEIHDGRDDTYPLVGNQKFCGYSVQFNPIYSSTHFVFARLNTDSSLQRKGFCLKYTRVEPPVTSFNCNFDTHHDMCYGWIQSQEDDFDWEFTSGHTPSGSYNATGPWRDHTLKTIDGTFAFIEASGKSTNDTAIMMTPPTSVAQAANYCFRFWYHMSGKGIGALMVYRLDEDEEVSNTSEVVFTKRSHQGRRWFEAKVNIPRSEARVRFAFVGVRGNRFTGDIALDDVRIVRGRCPVIITTTTTTTAPTTPTITRATTTRATTTSRTTRYTTTARSIFFQTPPPLRTTVPGGCPKGHMECSEMGNCVPPKYICDTEKDCLHNEDEQNCHAVGGHQEHCSWAEWAEWSQCSRTCGGGSRRKERATVNGKLGDYGCQGTSMITENCNTCRCSNWNRWTSWVECSVSCGKGGIQSRTRTCNAGTCLRRRCSGPSVEILNCNGHNCPKWGGFGAWTPCSVTCGVGLVSRGRTCIGGEIGQDGCVGNTTEVLTCKEHDVNFPTCEARNSGKRRMVMKVNAIQLNTAVKQ